VEPVFGHLKTCQKLIMMSRRGFTAPKRMAARLRRAQPVQTAPAPPAEMMI
jgi:hypothetical protein